MRHAFLPLLLLLCSTPLAPPALAQTVDDEFGLSVRLGYLTPQHGLSAAAGVEYQFFLGRQLVIPAFSMDLIMGLDEDEDYYRDSSNLCRSSADDAYVADILCTPEMSLAYRGEVQFRLGRTSLFAGPGIRIPGSGDTGSIEPYGFIILGEDLFIRASVGRGFQQYEIGVVFAM